MNTSNNWVITIGRQFGSGGREIGKLVADKLGIGYYDKELLIEAANQSGMSEHIFEEADERSPRFYSNIWSFNFGMNSGAYFLGDDQLGDEHIYRAQSEVMLTLADRGPCVMVGRTADYVLREHCRVISVFVHAPIEACIARVIQRGDCDNENDAKSLITRKNKLRAEYYNFYSDKRWGEAASYDLTIDSSLLPPETIAQLITDYVKLVTNHVVDDSGL